MKYEICDFCFEVVDPDRDDYVEGETMTDMWQMHKNCFEREREEYKKQQREEQKKQREELKKQKTEQKKQTTSELEQRAKEQKSA